MSDVKFSKEEFAKRLAEVKAAMSKRGFDVLVITEPSNIYYLTGYDSWSFYTPQALVVALDADMPIWFGRMMDGASARRITYLPEDSIQPYPDSYVQAVDRHPFQLLAQLIEKRGWGTKTIAVESDAYYYTARSHTLLVEGLPNARFKDAELLVNWVRIVKSPQEIRYLQEAGQIVERMLARALETIAPGVRECDVIGALYQAQMSGTPQFGGVYSTSPMFFCPDERAGEPHAIWSDRPLRPGVPINLEMAGVRHRYHGPISRTIFLGKPPQAYRDLAAGVVEGLNAALDAVKPGKTGEQIEDVWRKTIAKHGIEKESRIGYSIGIGFPPTWGERTASLRPGDRTVLQPNMAFHMMTGVWAKDTGVTITQAFYVTDTGHKPLTSVPRELIVKD
jgi:Xaa-Pro aminopeptidase